MKRLIFAAALALGLLGCASGPLTTPEAQIAAGANALAATTVVATTALRNDKITVAQAKSVRAVLDAAGTALDGANATLIACRAKQPVPPPAVDACRPAVVDLITLALDGIANAKRVLDAK